MRHKFKKKENNPLAYEDPRTEDGTERIFISKFNHSAILYKEFTQHNDPSAIVAFFDLMDLGALCEVKMSNSYGTYFIPMHGRAKVRRLLLGQLLKGHKLTPFKVVESHYRYLRKRMLDVKHLNMTQVRVNVWEADSYKPLR